MDPSDWLQGSIQEDFSGMDSSSPISGDMLTCARPLLERRLRPPHDQALKCPRCESTHTKFCYYNNYSLTQPRYFCKTCRRYWTKGGTLRNIPVGGGCRKNKKVSSSSNSGGKKSSEANSPQVPQGLNRNQTLGSSSNSTRNINPTDLHLSSNNSDHDHQVQFPPPRHFGINPNPNFWMENNKFINAGMLENPSRIDYDFMGNGNMAGFMNGLGDQMGSHNLPPKFHVSWSSSLSPSPHGMSLDGNNSINGGNIFMDTCNRFMIPYTNNIEGSMDQDQQNALMDVKPSTKLLSLEWHDQQNDHDNDQGCMDTNHGGKDNHHHPSFGYLNVNGLGSWNNGMINGYGPSTTNSLV